VQALCSAPERATPSDLLALGRLIHPGLSQVTVYRTLELLASLGLAQRLHRAEGCTSFVACSSPHGHHVTCERCKRTVEFEGCAIAEVARSASRQTGFAVSGHWLELTGLCPDCRRRSRS
jgi:Fe2+ or Zn2+ uptake regulation protein